MEGIGGAAEVGVGLPPLEGGTTISVKMDAQQTVGELNVEAHAVECRLGGGCDNMIVYKEGQGRGSKIVGGFISPALGQV